MKKFIFLLLICMISYTPCVFAAGITSYPALNDATFWLKIYPAGEELVLDEEQIEKLNNDIIKKSPTVFDLTQFPEKLPKNHIAEMIKESEWLFQEAFYAGGKPLSPDYKNLIAAERALDTIPDEISVKYAVTICRSNLRAMPTNQGWFYSAADTQFDYLQETALDPGEPVLVLHKSKSGNFLFVQMRNYTGWLPVWNVGMTDKKTWLEYVDPANFLIIVADKLTLKAGGKENLFQMGAKIPVKDLDDKTYTALFAGRGKEGQLVPVTATLPNDDDKYSLGFLHYTRHNIIKQSFRFIGTPYGWGGLQDAVDCSAMIERVYRTVGIELPRDADEQEETAGVRLVMEGLDNDARSAMMAALLPGDALFMPGHALIYLGKTQDIPYAIHALGSHYTTGQRTRVMKVVVSDLSLKVSNGKTHFEVISSALSYR